MKTVAQPLPENPTIVTRECVYCHVRKTENEYYGPRYRTCKACQNVKRRAFIESHPEEYRQRERRYRAKCFEYRKMRATQWRETNREQYNLLQRKWRSVNKAAYTASKTNSKARALGIPGEFTADEWTTLCEKSAFVCLCCRGDKVLTVDHIIPLCQSGPNTIDNIQPLCKSCNSKKGKSLKDYRKAC